jgi:hypothetical protein
MSTFKRFFSIGFLAGTFCCAAVSCPLDAWTASARAADPMLVPLEDAPPEDEVSAEIREVLDGGFAVMKSKTRTLCQVWLRKGVAVRDGFEPTLDELFAFAPGELIGVVRYKSKGADFREQQIPRGVYTLRFALQPVDGDHIGTSDTRDFLLLVAAADDETLAAVEPEEMLELSATAIESEHPGMLSLQPGSDDSASEDAASLRHDEDRDWWIVDFTLSGADGEPLNVALVVVGASEG